jgi:hypothetical protein
MAVFFSVAGVGKNLVEPIPRKAISSMPKPANWTPFALVVDYSLVRATDYGLSHRADSTRCFSLNSNISRAVRRIFHLCILEWHDGNGDVAWLSPGQVASVSAAA